MRFNDVLPFLKAGFEIRTGNDIGGSWSLHGETLFYKPYSGDKRKSVYNLNNFDLGEDTYRVVGVPDVNNLTHDQATQLMKAGYKLTIVNFIGDFYFMKNDLVYYYCSILKKQHLAFSFNQQPGFFLKDNKIMDLSILENKPEEKAMENEVKLEVYKENKIKDKKLRLKLEEGEYGEIKLIAVDEYGKVFNEGYLLSIMKSGKLRLHSGISNHLGLSLDHNKRIEIE